MSVRSDSSPPVELLGRHVLRRAGLRFAARDAGGRARQTEVGDLRAAAAVDHDVGGLEIAMQHALVVRRRQARAELPRDLDGLVFRQPADAAQQRRQILAVHVLHREEVRRAVRRRSTDVEDAADVRMRDAQRQADFVEEPLEPIRVALDVARQELQRDGLAELQVVGAVDLAHAAAAEQADHAIAAGEDRAGQETLGITPMPRRRRRERRGRRVGLVRVGESDDGSGDPQLPQNR